MTRRSEKIHRQKGVAWCLIMTLFLCLHFGVSSAYAAGAVEPVGTVSYLKIISMNGPWQRQFIDQFSLSALKPDKWTPVDIPSREGSSPTHFAAYRKIFALTAGNIDDRIIIHFKGVAFASQVYLNGRLVGGHGPTLEPFEHDLTPFLNNRGNAQAFQSHNVPSLGTRDKGGNDNELIILVQDWTSVLEKTQGQEISADAAGQGSNKDGVILQFSPGSPFDKSIWYKTVAPIGSNHRLFGIWDDVQLEVFPGVRVDDVAVDALIAEGRIRVTGQIHNQGTQAWQGRMTIAVVEGGDGNKSIGGCDSKKIVGDGDSKKIAPSPLLQRGGRGDFLVSLCPPSDMDVNKEIVVVDVDDIRDVAAGQRKSFQVILDAKGLTPWEPDRPVLYDLRINLGGGLCYRKVIPFGYRQIITKDHEIWLNGKKIHLFTASNGNNGFSRQQLVEHLQRLKDLNVNAVRFHANIFPGWYYDVADQMGMLVVAESAINGSYVVQNNYNSDLFFDNAAIHWQGLVGKFRNHPSVIVYSIENESIQYSHGNRAEMKFAELGRKVKKWDPTRPILFNGGDDPEGAADIISLHYPHELPFWNQYPKDAWWLGDVTSIHPHPNPVPSNTHAQARARRSIKIPLYPPLEKGGLSTHPIFAKGKQGDFYGTYIDFFWYHKPDFKWRWERKKPLDIGEIGYFYGGAPHTEAIISGDDAYARHRTIRDAVQGEIWKHSVEAARALDVAMINPWNPPAGPKANAALKEALKPVKLIPYPQATERYFSGAPLRWKGVLLNDTREQKQLSIHYSLREQAGHDVDVDEAVGGKAGQVRNADKRGKTGHAGNSTVRGKSKRIGNGAVNILGPFLVEPGGRQEVEIGFSLPKVRAVQDYEVKICVRENPLRSSFGKGRSNNPPQSPFRKGGSVNIKGGTNDLIEPTVAEGGGIDLPESPRGQGGGDEIRKSVSVYPRPAGVAWRRLSAVYLFDPLGETENFFKKLGLPYRKLTSIAPAAPATEGKKMPGTLIIGKDALTKLDDKEIRKLAERIAAGRESTLILEQEGYPLGFPPGLTLNERHGTTLGFVAAPGHPVVKVRDSGTRGNDIFRLWAADLNISRKDFNLPIGGGYRPLVVSGGTGGLIYASLIEKPGLSGTTLFSQLLLVEKAHKEPAAAEILFNAIRYLESPEQARSAEMTGGEAARARKLQHMESSTGKSRSMAAGANMSQQGRPDWASSGKKLHLPDALREHLSPWGIHAESAVLTDDYQGIIMMTAAELARQPQAYSRLEDWIKAGNILWLTGIDDQTLPLISPPVRGLKVVSLSKESLPVKIAGRDSEAPVVRNVENSWNASLLTQGLLNQYLYWPAPLPDVTYNFASLLPPSKWALELAPLALPPLSLKPHPHPNPNPTLEGERGNANFENLSPGWWKLTEPAVIMAAQSGKGLIIIDTLDWAEILKPQYASLSRPVAHFPPPVSVMAAGENQERALRLFTTLLTNAGARVDTAPFVQIEAESMSEKTPGQPVMRNWEHHYWEIFKNNYIAASFRVPDFPSVGKEGLTGFIDIKARSLIQMQDPPRMRVVLDGEVVGEVDVTEPRWQIYRFKVIGKSGDTLPVSDLVGKTGDTIPNPGAIGSCPQISPQISGSDHRIEVHLVNNPDDAYNNRQLRVDWVRMGK